MTEWPVPIMVAKQGLTVNVFQRSLKFIQQRHKSWSLESVNLKGCRTKNNNLLLVWNTLEFIISYIWKQPLILIHFLYTWIYMSLWHLNYHCMDKLICFQMNRKLPQNWKTNAWFHLRRGKWMLCEGKGTNHLFKC